MAKSHRAHHSDHSKEEPAPGLGRAHLSVMGPVERDCSLFDLFHYSIFSLISTRTFRAIFPKHIHQRPADRPYPFDTRAAPKSSLPASQMFIQGYVENRAIVIYFVPVTIFFFSLVKVHAAQNDRIATEITGQPAAHDARPGTVPPIHARHVNVAVA